MTTASIGSRPVGTTDTAIFSTDHCCAQLPACIQALAEKILKIWDGILECIQQLWDKLFSSKPITEEVVPLYPMPSMEEMKRTYRALGDDKWKEIIDGEYHRHGKEVFDRGLHGRTVEPGFIGSAEKACDVIEESLGQRLTPEFYLRVHKVACGHFRGDATGTLMGQEKVGVFRNVDDMISMGLTGDYRLSAEGIDEFNRTGLGVLQFDGLGGAKLLYKLMSRAEIEAKLKEYIADYENEIIASKTQNDKLLAIARFTQRLEWLHPVRDGSGRMWILLLGKLLVENGFHPAILDLPYRSACRGLKEWCEYLKQGLVAWERAKASRT
jgi:hypothetical protein